MHMSDIVSHMIQLFCTLKCETSRKNMGNPNKHRHFPVSLLNRDNTET